MGNLRVFGNRRPEIAIIKQTIQFTLFLIVCLWLLYQIHLSLYVSRDSGCDFIDERVIDERIVKLLGRKAGLGRSHYAEEMELYGVDLIGEAVTINNASDSDSDSDVDDNRFGNPIAEENDEREHVETGIVDGKKVNEDSEIDSVVKVNAVILKSGEKYESGPSKRSNVEVESVQNGVMSKTENQTKEAERCQYICSKNATDREGEVVEIKMPEVVTVKPEKRSMRDILLSEM